jgi:hypothetical protein
VQITTFISTSYFMGKSKTPGGDEQPGKRKIKVKVSRDVLNKVFRKYGSVKRALKAVADKSPKKKGRSSK